MDLVSVCEMDCFGDDREASDAFARFFNCPNFSDVTLIVCDELSQRDQLAKFIEEALQNQIRFYAHKLILVKSSEVFERMLSQQWDGEKKEIELVEDRLCAKVFPAFLRFLYCNHIVLNADDALPVLILADKYNVPSLRKVCLEFAVNHIIPHLSLKDIFHVWFQYGSKCFHLSLVTHCVVKLSSHFQDIISQQEWEREWLTLDREQLAIFLKNSDLTVASEYELWQAVSRWMQSPSHPERRGSATEKNLAALLPLIRFPLMTADELYQLERCPLVEQHQKLFQPHLMLAYKYQALPLGSRANSREFLGSQFLLRNYTELRWDKRLILPDVPNMLRYSEATIKVTTKASAVPPAQPWDWELKIHPKGFSSATDEFRCILVSNVILDQTRPVEYLLSVADDKKILKSVSGKKIFSKTRYSQDLEMDKKISVDEITAENSPLLVNNDLVMQLTMRPIE